MNKSYLFFDIECANCFDGIGKMCSFGYVLTDAEFNILDSDDVVMNPETEFDWYLFSPKNRCPLAYSKDYFRAQRNFEAYYKPLKKLIEAPDRKVIGFSSANDVGFIVSACERYNLPLIQFAAFDIAVIVDNAKGEKKGLADWCAHYNIDTSSLQAHKSEDDAVMTMKLTQAFCKENNTGIEELLEKNKGCRLSVEKYLEHREIKRHNDEVMQKIQELYGKKCRAVLTNRLKGDYTFGFKIKKDIDESLKIATLVFKHGGILKKSLKANGTVIIEDDTPEEYIQQMKKKNLTPLTISDFYEIVRME